MIFFIIAIIIILLFVFLYYQNNKADVTRYKITDEKIKGTVKIVHLSDLHSKPFSAVLKILASVKPDLIMITGDYINDKGRKKNKMLEFGKKLTEFAPVYYITGNHERRLEYFDSLMGELKETGFNVLLDETDEITVNGTVIDILGLDENQASMEAYKARKKGTFEYKDVKPLFDKFCSKDGYKIVLSHFPENFEMVGEMNYSRYDFDLQLSGHAHGGQFILPFIGPVLSPGQGFFPKYAQGSVGEKPKLIVSRGIGNAEFPFRLFNHPEIIVIRLSKPLDEE